MSHVVDFVLFQPIRNQIIPLPIPTKDWPCEHFGIVFEVLHGKLGSFRNLSSLKLCKTGDGSQEESPHRIRSVECATVLVEDVYVHPDP